MAAAAALAAAIGLLAAILIQASSTSTPPPRAQSVTRARSLVAALPSTLSGPASAALGAHTPSYTAHSTASGAVSVVSEAQHLKGVFSAAGVTISARHGLVHLRAAGVGLGTHLRPLVPVRPIASGNRVLYTRSGVGEWYANGPLGIEQGFTVARAPAAGGSGPLTIALATGETGLRPALQPGGSSVTFFAGTRAALRYGGLFATDSRGRSLHAWMALHGGRLLLRVDTAGASYPIHIDPLLQDGSEIEGEGEFGYSVAMSEDGSTAIVGEPGGVTDKGHGRVIVFGRSGATWSEVTRLANPGAGANEFGRSVALSADGNTAIVGAPNAGPEPETGPSGAAYMFTRSGSTWSSATLIGCNLATEEEACVRFGVHVAVSGDGHTALIGAEPSAANAFVGPSDTWAFTRSGESWSQQGGPVREGGESISQHVALSNDGNTALIAGYFFTRSEGIWTEQANEGEVIGDMALSHDGNTAILGRRVFVRSEGSWSQQDEFTGGFGGVALSSDGNTALIGDPYSKEARLYTRSEGSWSLRERLVPAVHSQEPPQQAGYSVALAGNASAAVIGGPATSEPFSSIEGGAWFFAEPVAPTATTGAASAITASGATLNASVDPNAFEVSSCHFEYGTSEAYGQTAPCSPAPGSGTSAVAVSAAISGLSAQTTYHVRVVATNAGGTTNGSDATFSTLPARPAVATESATGVTHSEATLQATVNPDGALVTTCAFEYGTTEAYGSSIPCETSPGAGTTPVSVSARLSGLSPNTRYHYRIVATSGGGTADGGDEAVQTLPLAPVVEVGGAKQDKYRTSEVTLYFFVNPHGGTVTECELEYGLTNTYGSSVACSPSPGSGEGRVEVHATITGFTHGAEYMYRVSAASAGGTTRSENFRFTAPQMIPEFGRCVKAVAPAAGEYFTSTCVNKTTPNKWAWEPGVESRTFKMPVKVGTKVVLEGVSKEGKVTCSGGTGGGEINGLQTVSAVSLTLTGCEVATAPCGSCTKVCQSKGDSAGEIGFSGMTGELGVNTYGNINKYDKVGLDLSGESTFECGGVMRTSIAGTVIGALTPADTMTTTRSLKFTQAHGLQKPEAFAEELATTPLEWKLHESFGSPVRVGLTMTASFITSEKVEIDTVI